ncbi:MAG: S8 family serine peptidase [Candidatus Eisenbacteria bacterium]|nr:S8 family serine peptidase [Candidatus Eisenbacteria bacterium]
MHRSSGLNWWEYATHGTSVAGVAGARGNNGSLVAGVANLDASDPDPFLVAIKIAGTAQSPPATVSELDVAAGLDHICSPIVYPSVKVTNHSYGIIAYRNCNSTPSPAYRDAARNAYQKNILCVSSAGNETVCAGNIPSCGGQVPDTCVYYPGAFPEYSLTVTTVDCWGQVGSPLQVNGSHIDVSAPGGWQGDITTTLGGGGITTLFGQTSAAAPMASGLAALLLGRDSRLINDDLSEILRRTTRPVGSYSPIDVGRGLVQADSVLMLLDSPRQLGFAAVTGNYASQYLETRDVQLRNVSGVGLTGENWGNFRVEVWQVDYIGILKSPFGTPALYDTIFDLAWPRHRLSTGWRHINEQINSSYDAKFFGNHVDLLSYDPSGSAHFRTYTYKIFDETGQQFLCWQPFKPAGQAGSCPSSGSFRISYGVVAHQDIPGVAEREVPHDSALRFRTSARVVSGELVLHCRATARSNVKITVIDTSGRCAHVFADQVAVAGGETIARAPWPSGLGGSVYLLRFTEAETGRNLATEKVVVSR